MQLLGVQAVKGDQISLARTNAAHLGQGGTRLSEEGSEASFEGALMRAMDGVSGKQMDAERLSQRMITDPDSVDAHDLTIAQAEANMSLNIARTIIDRVVRGWKDVLNAR